MILPSMRMAINESQIMEEGKHSNAKYFVALCGEQGPVPILVITGRLTSNNSSYHVVGQSLSRLVGGLSRSIGATNSNTRSLFISSAVLSLLGDLNEFRF